MYCIKCDAKTKVKDTRYTLDGRVTRYRVCDECFTSFYTLEDVVEDMDLVREAWASSKRNLRDNKKLKEIE